MYRGVFGSVQIPNKQHVVTIMSQKEFEVEAILDQNDRTRECRVKWKGYKDPTWEPLDGPIKKIDVYAEFLQDRPAPVFVVYKVLRKTSKRALVSWAGNYPDSWVPLSVMSNFWGPERRLHQKKRLHYNTRSPRPYLTDPCYSDSTCSKTANKKTVNTLFSRALDAQTNRHHPKHPVVLLDGIGMSSFEAVKHLGRTVFIPNQSADVCEAMFRDDDSNHDRKLAQVLNTTLSKFIGRSDTEQFLGCFLDYCCTYDGSDMCSPREDIRQIFEGTNMVSDGGVLAVTLCLRDRRQKGKTRPQELERILSGIQESADEAGVKICLHNQHLYKEMVFLMFSVELYSAPRSITAQKNE
jgi:hypothetical protein